MPRLAFVELIAPPAVKLPVTLSNVKLALPAYTEPPSLNITCALDPCAGINVAVSQVNPPEPFVFKNAPATPPVIDTFPLGPKLVSPLTVNPVNVPRLVIFA